MYSTTSNFKWLNIQTQRHQARPYYAARLHQRLGRTTIGLGGDEIQALAIAQQLDAEIERLIANGEQLDLEHLKSFVATLKQPKQQMASLRVVRKDEIETLWKKYTDFSIAMQRWEKTYILNEISVMSRLIEKCPHKNLEDKNKIIEWIFSDTKRSTATSKKWFMHLVAAVDWHSKQGNIPRKWGIEYRDALESIKLKSTKKEKKEIDIYSVAEVYQIIDALKNDTYSRFKGKHQQYYKYVYFCWLTGCRPSEAIALKWENVNLQKKSILFCEAQVDASGTIVQKQNTKTELKRIFPVNQELKDLLESIPHREGFVFLNDRGKAINQHALNVVWKTVLSEAGIRYRVPYQLRHTMISYHANNDFPIHKLARLMGNSPEVITEHYLHLEIERIRLPEVITETDI
ncbi:site-specific integrase [Microcoleus sp. ARI1-B5]|uniref:tyrosine-type recombinase/integrase n=1 Tax=unclassified Microcoleus TaxID=2642155 RepID=UPI002FD03F24